MSKSRLNCAFHLIIATIVFTSCSSMQGGTGGEQIKDLDQPLLDIQKAVEARLPLGKRMTSPNGREFYSRYFTVVDGRIQPGDHATDRFYAHVFVLGDQRPYLVEVLVKRERRVGRQGSDVSNQYEEVARDVRLARLIAKRIQQTLSKRREDRNIIDDFRVF